MKIGIKKNQNEKRRRFNSFIYRYNGSRRFFADLSSFFDI